MVEFANKGFEIITGYTPTEVIGRKPSVLKSGKNDDVFYRDLWRHLTDQVFEELKLREQASHDSLADIDDFKPVNDRFGHQRGDDIIKTVANILLAETRKTDKCIRWGGEEFIVLLPFCGLARVRAR
ncbi:diguanylate cyclase [Marinobacter sp.]|uniref:diguanylate cyclase n=1 Tax=Marinobacter sp. TaxID=50741 RepID=UPI0035625272